MLSANSASVQDILKCYTYGYYSTANGADTFTIRFKIGSTTILSYTSTAANVTNAAWHTLFTSTVRTIGAGGTFIAFAEGNTNSVNTDVTNTATTAIDTTASNTFTVTVQWSNALAGNTLTIQQAYTKLL